VTAEKDTLVSWNTRKAPSLADFEAIAATAYAGLPEAFREASRDVQILIEDFPTEEVMVALDCETPFDLLGLFQGIGIAQGPSTPYTGQMPNAVTLYRRPILDYWAEHDETLDAIIAHVLIHEIGHHFGFSDADMEAIEEQAD
jgi:predicted Zn-dependent protease with MMP-like domain